MAAEILRIALEAAALIAGVLIVGGVLEIIIEKWGQR